MKKIEAYIRPEKLEDVKDMVIALSLHGLSVTQVMGCGKQKGWTFSDGAKAPDCNLLPKIKIELVVPDERTEEVVDRMMETARTGAPGDGKIFISDIGDAVRIRTGERGVPAIK